MYTNINQSEMNNINESAKQNKFY